MEIGITGASGHVGGALCRLMLEKGGHDIRVLLHQGEDWGTKGLELETFSGNVLDYGSLLRFAEGQEVVIHLAAKISIAGDPDGSVRKVNYQGGINIIRACREAGVRRLVYFSSIHAMNPLPQGKTLDESRELVGLNWKGSAYDRSKADMERYIKRVSRDCGLEIVVLAPTAVIGPYDFQPSLQGSALLDMYRGKLPALVRGGYDWVDVRDVAQATLDAIHYGKDREKYILSGEFITLAEMAGIVAEHSPHPAPSWVLPVWVARLGVPFAQLQSWISKKPPIFTHEALTAVKHGSAQITSQKAQKTWDYTARPVRESIRDTLGWFEAQGWHSRAGGK